MLFPAKFARKEKICQSPKKPWLVAPKMELLAVCLAGADLAYAREADPMKQTCFVCQNVDCKLRGSEKIMNELADKVAGRSLEVEVKPYLCFGGCEEGPNVVIHPQKIWYAGVKMEDLPEILDSLAGGPVVTRLDTIDPALKEVTFALLDTGVF
jgi:(2Fe-2S) ferredoxin